LSEEDRVNVHVVLVALAVLELRELGYPAWSGKVHCLSDIKAKVKSLMIGG